jgi:type II secretory pathway pseudopilin PulG
MSSNARVTEEPPKKKTALILGIVLGCGCLTVIVVGLIAAIAIPSMMKARSGASRASALGDIRTVISAQAVYQSISGGRYGTLECLAAPASCVSSYTGPEFIDKNLLLPEKGGYRRTFTLSANGEHYTYIAVPVSSSVGTRAFCGDGNGIVCQSDGGIPDTNRDGDCDLSTCSVVQ